MRHKRFEEKKIGKNFTFFIPQKYIFSEERRTPGIAAIWGRQYVGKSDKESSHDVGKFFDRKWLRYDFFPPGQSSLAAGYSAFGSRRIPDSFVISAGK